MRVPIRSRACRPSVMRPRSRSRITALFAMFTTTALLPVALAATPASAATACTATYTVVNSWSGGFQGAVHLINNGDPVASWTLTWTSADGQKITQGWGGTHQNPVTRSR